MISITRGILIFVVACILTSALCADAAAGRSEAPPIQALRSLYRNNMEFQTLMDKAFANIKDPDIGPANPWKGKRFDDLCAFFKDWYYLLPVKGRGVLRGCGRCLLGYQGFSWVYK
jgi:hypothetical protein